MLTSNIVVEITIDHYSLKLGRDKSNLNVMKRLLNRIKKEELHAKHKNRLDDDDLRSRRLDFETEIFDRLCDK